MKNIFSTILSFVILFSSMGFTLSTHHCGGKKVKSVLSIGDSHLSCGMLEIENKCTDEEQMKSDCCKNEYQKIQVEDDYTFQILEKELSFEFVVSFVAIYFNLFQEVKTEQDLFSDCSPPPLIKDIPVFTQSFLI